MVDSLIASLLDYSALGLFAIYLIYQSIVNSKKSDKLILDFREEIDKMRETRKDEIETLRARYDTVIEDLNEHRDSLRDDVIGKTKAVLSKIHAVHQNVETVSIAITEMRQEEKLRRIAGRTEE